VVQSTTKTQEIRLEMDQHTSTLHHHTSKGDEGSLKPWHITWVVDKNDLTKIKKDSDQHRPALRVICHGSSAPQRIGTCLPAIRLQQVLEAKPESDCQKVLNVTDF